jgi:serine/threonine-protein kinase
MTAPALPLADRPAFLDAVAAAGLLSPGQLEKATAALPADAATAAQVARYLVQTGVLTAFQADRVLAGRTDGFVLGQYVVLEQIGRGTTARVYKARHRAMQRPVAVKVLSPHLTRTPAARTAFDRQVRAAARLNHPNVVTTYDANEVGDRSYVVLEYVDGPSLETLVRERGPLTVPQACDFVRQAAWGLQHGHERGLVHGDVKPSDLLAARPSAAAPACVLKVADFGLARLGGCPSAPDYAAPDRDADARSDLYSLGCVFHFLLTGRPPFSDGTPAMKARRHKADAPARVDRLRPDVPPAVADVVQKLLAKDPAARFATAAELALTLEGLAACVYGLGGFRPEGAAVSFDLPPRPAPPDLNDGYLSGLNPSPWAELTADGAAHHTLDDALGQTPVAPARAKQKPKPAPPARPRGGSAWRVLLLCAGVVAASGYGLAQVLRTLMK